MDKFFEGVATELRKIRSILVDRRFKVAVVAILGLLALLGFTVDLTETQIDQLLTDSDTALAAAITLVGYMGAVAGLVMRLIQSWEVRPPSDLTNPKVTAERENHPVG